MRFHHLSMNVDNYEQCLAFYLGIGLQMYCECTWEDTIDEHEKGSRSCFLCIGSEPVIELHEVHSVQPEKGIIGHMCFILERPEDVTAKYELALKLGANKFVDPFTMDLLCNPKPVRDAVVCHVLGPAGEQIEFICWNGYDPF